MIKLLSVCIIAGAVTACGTTGAAYRPVVDQPTAYYESDLAQCQALAESRGYDNDEVKSSSLGGAALGALLGGADEGWDGALVGALIGGTAGAASEAWGTRDVRKNIVVNCLAGRGHKVAG